MVRLVTFAMAVALLGACASTEATPSAGPSAGQASLQSPPFTEPKFVAPPGQPTKPSAKPAPAQSVQLSAVAAQFDPARQHFVWVLPAGIHGKGPWDMRAVVKYKGETKFETTIPLKAETSAGGTRTEYPTGYEIVRLTDDGSWARHTAEIDKVIDGLIEQYGRGQGSLEMTNDLNVTIDQTHHQTYCIDNKQPDVRLYVEETGAADLIRLDVAAMAPIIQLAVKKACGA